jgi:hypothetical protein
VSLAYADVGLTKYTFSWTSDSSGYVRDVLTPGLVRGYIVQLSFIPGSGGVQPSDQYDVVLYGYGDTADLLTGNGADLSNSVASVVPIATPVYWDGTTAVDLTVTNAGAEKEGQVIVWIAGDRPPR